MRSFYCNKRGICGGGGGGEGLEWDMRSGKTGYRLGKCSIFVGESKRIGDI